MITLDIFNDWFSGNWNNARQAHSNPRGQTHVIAKHEKISDMEFRCVYSYHRTKIPYRDFNLSVNVLDNEVILKNKKLKLVFQLGAGVYTCNFDESIDNKRYIFQAVLGNGFYYVNDQSFEEDGTLVRGLPTGEFYDFRKD